MGSMDDMPPSWVPKLHIARDKMDMRCPKVGPSLSSCRLPTLMFLACVCRSFGRRAASPSWILPDLQGIKMTLYHHCQHELFALFGECGRWDGMIEKLIIYADDERTEIIESREKYARRKDKLRERRMYPASDVVKEFFDPGSSNGIMDITVTKGTRREVNLYHKRCPAPWQKLQNCIAVPDRCFLR